MTSSFGPGRHEDDHSGLLRTVARLTEEVADLQRRLALLEAEAVRTRPSPDARLDGSDGAMYLPGNRDDMP